MVSFLFLEAPPGIGPGIEVLQTFALPLGHGAVHSNADIIPRYPNFVNAFCQKSFKLIFDSKSKGTSRGVDYGALNPRFRHRLVKIRGNHSENCSGLQSKPERVRAVRLGFENKKEMPCISFLFLERITGLEPATSTLARSRSTK